MLVGCWNEDTWVECLQMEPSVAWSMLSLGHKHIWASKTGWVAVWTQWNWVLHYRVLLPSGVGGWQ